MSKDLPTVESLSEQLKQCQSENAMLHKDNLRILEDLKKFKDELAGCWYCKYRGKRFRVNGEGHVHCEHPKTETDKCPDCGQSLCPWMTLRRCWDSCELFELEMP